MRKPDSIFLPQNRRGFLNQSAAMVAATAAAGTALSNLTFADDKASGTQAETLVKVLYESLKPEQRAKICYDWNFIDPKRGLLRTRVANN